MTKKSVIKIWILIAIITVISFSDWTFAVEWDTDWHEISQLLNAIVSILSWIWVWFAKWAGEFLTNRWVYGELLWLDAMLWKWWNVMKNMANFWLWFYFVYLILSEIIGNISDWIMWSKATKTIKDKISWILIAWIWIQASRFLTAVVIDISTITLVTVGSFPSQIVSENPKVEEYFEVSISDYLQIELKDGKTLWDIINGVKYSLFLTDENRSKYIKEVKTVPLDKKITKKELFDEIMPNADNVSGPLYYLWFAILNTPKLTSVDSSSEASWKSTIFNTLLQWWTTIVYSIEMLILFIFVVMRVAYMRMFIVLSPLVILLRCIGKSSKNKSLDKWFLGWVTTNINFETFLWNAFKPTIIVLWFSVAIIFTTLMKWVIISSAQKTIDLWWVTSFTYNEGGHNTGDEGDQKYTSVIDGNIMGITIRYAWKTLLEFILSIITVILVYHIIQFAVKMWGSKDFLSKKIDNLQKTVWDFITKVPIIPVTTKDNEWKPVKWWISIGSLASIPNRLMGDKLYEYQHKDDGIVDSFMKRVWLQDDNRLTSTEIGKIQSIWHNSRWLGILEEKRDYIKTIRVEGWKWMVLDPTVRDKTWQNVFSRWLTDMKDKTGDIRWDNADVWISMINRWNRADENTRTLERMFKDNGLGVEKSVKAYATLFWLKWNITSWEILMRKDISSKEDTESEWDNK